MRGEDLPHGQRLPETYISADAWNRINRIAAKGRVVFMKGEPASVRHIRFTLAARTAMHWGYYEAGFRFRDVPQYFLGDMFQMISDASQRAAKNALLGHKFIVEPDYKTNELHWDLVAA